MKDDPRLVNQVTEALDQYYWAFSSRDIGLMSDVFLCDDKFVAFGTDIGEYWIGWREFEGYLAAQFEALSDVRFERRNLQIRVSPEGETAWFTETAIGHFITKDKDCIEEPLRVSGVFVRVRDGWKLANFHRSIPVKGSTIIYTPDESVPLRF